MAYVYFDDGGPEAEEYDSNYYYFDDTNPEALAAVEKMLTSNAPRDEAFRSEFEKICQASFDRPAAVKPQSHYKRLAAGVISFVAGLSALFLTHYSG